MQLRSGYHRNVEVELTSRQRDVLRLIAQGKTNAEIADSLGIGYESVKSYVSEVLGKLGVDRREEAAAWWQEEHSLRRRLARLGPGIFVVVPRGAAALAGVRMMVPWFAWVEGVSVALAAILAVDCLDCVSF